MMSNGTGIKKRMADDQLGPFHGDTSAPALLMPLNTFATDDLAAKRMRYEETRGNPGAFGNHIGSMDAHSLVPGFDNHNQPMYNGNVTAPLPPVKPEHLVDSTVGISAPFTSMPMAPVPSGPPPPVLAPEYRHPENMPVQKIPQPPVYLSALNGGPRKPSMTREQLKYCGAIIKNLKKHRDAAPFLVPVDPVLFKIPDYPNVVKNPMDLSTVEMHLNNVEYDTVDDFVYDVNLIFSNCYLYNGRELPVSLSAANLEAAFQSSLRHMPKEVFVPGFKAPPVEVPVIKETPKKPSVPKPKKEPVKKEEKKDVKILGVPLSAPSFVPPAPFQPPVNYAASAPTTIPQQSRATSEERRPKRDIHAPSKEIPTGIAVKRKSSTKWKADAQLRYCHTILREFAKKSNNEFMFPFMEPVDPIKFNIPEYPKIIKYPMDVSTIREKLESDQYEKADQFESDVRLMISNCFRFNPENTPVNILGKRLEKLFNEKWADRPPPPTPPAAEEVTVDSEDDSSDDKIAEMERKMKNLAEKLKTMKASKKKEKEREKEKPEKTEKSDKAEKAEKKQKATAEKAPKPKVASKSPAKTPAKPAKAVERKPAPSKRSRPVYTSSDDDTPMISFEQKKELSDAINRFQGDKLASVVQIIHNSMPHLRDNGGQEEIELDMDTLDPKTLHKLYQYVKKNTTVKRKKPVMKKVKVHYSEEDASKKITELERTLQKFDQPSHSRDYHGGMDDHSSSSSGSSSSSDSDSDDSGSSSD